MSAPTRAGDRYRLDEPLARGGMATVYRGHDDQLDRPVAVKLMRTELGDDANVLRRFQSEALRAASITDPHVVAIYDVGVQDGVPYIVMELVEGGDLAAALARERPIAPERAARIGADVATALEAAHAAGVVHRDVKPGNILLDADGRARVADFGIARATGEESLTGTGHVLGSVEYFSPEQARGEPATAASDIYALGVVLYELVTGERPFHGDTPYAVATARLRVTPPDPRAVSPAVPDELAAIIRRAMALAPADRFISAAGLRRALEEWLDHVSSDRRGTATLPVGVRSSLERKRPRRGVGPWPVAAGLLLLVVAGYVGMQALAGEADDGGTADPFEVIVGTPAGEAMPATTSPTPSSAPGEPSAEPSPTTTAEPDPTREATPAATTAQPRREATPAAATAQPTPPPNTPVPALAVADGPEDAVAAFYRYVADGDFDAAYALWSDRMKATYEREENLDGRWAQTASITFSQLTVASQSSDAATVQANFTERYDSGGSREFIGYWRLVRTDRGWLLDEPTY